jgi:hypothetical protein
MSNDKKDSSSSHRASPLTALATRIREIAKFYYGPPLQAIADELDTLAHSMQEKDDQGSSDPRSVATPTVEQFSWLFGVGDYEHQAAKYWRNADEGITASMLREAAVLRREVERLSQPLIGDRSAVGRTETNDPSIPTADALAGYRAALERLPVHVMPDLGQNPDTFPAAGEYVRVEDLRAALPVPALAPQMTDQLGSHFVAAGPVIVGCMAKDSREALELAMERWSKHHAAREPKPDDLVYSFAYWLFRWSGIVTSVDLNAPENPWSDPRPRQAPIVER